VDQHLFSITMVCLTMPPAKHIARVTQQNMMGVLLVSGTTTIHHSQRNIPFKC